MDSVGSFALFEQGFQPHARNKAFGSRWVLAAFFCRLAVRYLPISMPILVPLSASVGRHLRSMPGTQRFTLEAADPRIWRIVGPKSAQRARVSPILRDVQGPECGCHSPCFWPHEMFSIVSTGGREHVTDFETSGSWLSSDVLWPYLPRNSHPTALSHVETAKCYPKSCRWAGWRFWRVSEFERTASGQAMIRKRHQLTRLDLFANLLAF